MARLGMPDLTLPVRIAEATKARQLGIIRGIGQNIGRARERSAAEKEQERIASSRKINSAINIFNAMKTVDLPAASKILVEALGPEFGPILKDISFDFGSEALGEDIEKILKQFKPDEVLKPNNLKNLMINFAQLRQKHGTKTAELVQAGARGRLTRELEATPRTGLRLPTPIEGEEVAGPPEQIVPPRREALLELARPLGFKEETIRRFEGGAVSEAVKFDLKRKKFDFEVSKLENAKLLAKDKATKSFIGNVTGILKVGDNLVAGGISRKQADKVMVNMLDNLAKTTKADVSTIRDIFVQKAKEEPAATIKEGPGIFTQLGNLLADVVTGFQQRQQRIDPEAALAGELAGREAQQQIPGVLPEGFVLPPDVDRANFIATMKQENMTADQLLQAIKKTPAGQ
jgi:hypothetical protein